MFPTNIIFLTPAVYLIKSLMIACFCTPLLYSLLRMMSYYWLGLPDTTCLPEFLITLIIASFRKKRSAISSSCGNRSILFPCGLWGCIFWVPHKSIKNLISLVYNTPFMRFRAIESNWIKLKLNMWCSTIWDLGPKAIKKWRK